MSGGIVIPHCQLRKGGKEIAKPQLELLLEAGLELGISWPDYHPSLLPQLAELAVSWISLIPMQEHT